MENQFLVRRVKSLELVLDGYIEWKKDTKKFKGESKDRTSSLISDE